MTERDSTSGPPPLSPRERRLDRVRLQGVVQRFEYQAALIRNSSGDSKAEERAGHLLDQAAAIKRLLAENVFLRLKLSPTAETPQRLADYLTGGRE